MERNFAKIIHDVALAIERHNAMSMPILAVFTVKNLSQQKNNKRPNYFITDNNS